MTPQWTQPPDRQIPRALTPLVGRDREFSELTDLVLDPDVSLLTLVGPGGVGKTHLARHLVAHLSGGLDRPVDVVVLEHLLEPDLLVPTIAEALGVSLGPGEDALTGLIRALRSQPRLLILDNLEQVIDASWMLTPLRQGCPQLTLLVTSREALRLTDERLYVVQPLAVSPRRSLASTGEESESPAVQLFVARARAVDRSFMLTPANRASVMEICRRTDGLPLAIELAAARLRSFPVDTLASQFRDRLTLLTGRSRDMPVRQQTMRNAVQWSHDLLPPAERHLFRWLAVFAGGFRLDALESVVHGVQTTPKRSHSPMHVLDGLESLVDKSLVVALDRTPERERFGMLESIRDFALEQLEASEDVAMLRAAHARWCLVTVEAVNLREAVRQGNHHDLTGIENEFDNLRTALVWYHDTGQGELLARLCLGLEVLWHAGSRIDEGYRWSLRALAVLERDTGPQALQLRLLMFAGRSAWHLGYFAEAEQQLARALILARTVCNPAAEMKILLDLGLLAEMQGDDDAAATWFHAVLEQQREAGDLRGVLVALTNLGDVAYRQHQFATSRTLSEEALHLVQIVVDPEMECLIRGNLGQLDLQDLNTVAALHQYRHALSLALTARNDLLLADVLIGMAGVTELAQRPIDAAILLGASEARCARFGSHMVPHHGLRRRVRENLQQLLSSDDLEQSLEIGLQLEDVALLDLVRHVQPGPSGRTPPGVPALTPREQTVLALLVDGASDRAIAEALYISPRTAMRHVGTILKKLGVHNRVAAANLAREWHLV